MKPGEAWKTLKSKGPVDVESVQVKVEQCFNFLKGWIPKEHMKKLRIAQGHALLGEGREEWDSVCKFIILNRKKDE